jgi:hypothetical protein
LDAETR